MEEIIPILHNLFQKTEEDAILLNSIYEVSIMLTSKPDKNITRNKQKHITEQYLPHENRH